MSFTDLLFLAGFFPLSFLIYLPFSKSVKVSNVVLFVLSLIFYGFGGWKNLMVLLFMILFVYAAGQVMKNMKTKAKRRMNLIATTTVLIIVFLVYRYLHGLSESLQAMGLGFVRLFPYEMPVGLSFYMFSLLSYYFDLYQKRVEVQKNPISLGLYCAFFGRVNMGPIGHYESFAPQLNHHPISFKRINKGAALFVQGLVMKVLLADNFALIFGQLSGDASWLGNLLFGFSYFFQLYFDFAGYSRMARGIGSLFGFEIPENFHLPYTAISVQEFWRRWHISLTGWFRRYVYIPLGGNRVSHSRWIINILVVWLLTGFWHGGSWTFLFWGLWQAALILLEHQIGQPRLNRLPKFLRHALVVLTQLIGWTLFFSPTLLSAFETIGRYFGLGTSGLASAMSLTVCAGSLWLFIIGIFISAGAGKLIAQIIRKLSPSSYKWMSLAAYGICFMVCLSFLVASTSQSFLYAAF